MGRRTFSRFTIVFGKGKTYVEAASINVSVAELVSF